MAGLTTNYAKMAYVVEGHVRINLQKKGKYLPLLDVCPFVDV